MVSRIIVTLGQFGPYLKKENIEGCLQGTTFESIKEQLESFFGLPFNALSKEILERYIDITTEKYHVNITPHTEEIKYRLLNPLKLAKKSYCLGDYLLTMASCGVVGEMLAILIWKVNEVKIGSCPMSEEDEKGLFGNSFENLGQEKRLKVLKTFKFVNEDQFKDFSKIRDSRRPYLHLWKHKLSESGEKEDALEVLKSSFKLFKEITGIGLATAGTVKINPLLKKLFKHLDEEDKS
jgi:hypothetical protein